MAGVWFFTENDAFRGTGTREQDPIAAVQLHVTYKFKRTMWLAGDANYFTGGRTTINGRHNVDLQRNSRVGATFSSAIARGEAIRASVSHSTYHDDRRGVHVSRSGLQLRVVAVTLPKLDMTPTQTIRNLSRWVVALLFAAGAAACSGAQDAAPGASPAATTTSPELTAQSPTRRPRPMPFPKP